MLIAAKWANGESALPQARPAANIEWAWANGESGDVPVGEYAAAGFLVVSAYIPMFRRRKR